MAMASIVGLSIASSISRASTSKIRTGTAPDSVGCPSLEVGPGPKVTPRLFFMAINLCHVQVDGVQAGPGLGSLLIDVSEGAALAALGDGVVEIKPPARIATRVVARGAASRSISRPGFDRVDGSNHRVVVGVDDLSGGGALEFDVEAAEVDDSVLGHLSRGGDDGDLGILDDAVGLVVNPVCLHGLDITRKLSGEGVDITTVASGGRGVGRSVNSQLIRVGGPVGVLLVSDELFNG
mmetsp:Transcript_10453/g.20759  ORF Transcript_10453/g.20759 Transcript_10453/m.20759 type:complete len:237 (+) Transcript_10453:454-1164(+)